MLATRTVSTDTGGEHLGLFFLNFRWQQEYVTESKGPVASNAVDKTEVS